MNSELVLEMAAQLDKLKSQDAHAYWAAKCLSRMREEVSVNGVETVADSILLKLSPFLCEISVNNDEPRFTTEDYIDAVCNNTFLTLEQLAWLLEHHPDSFDETVIRIAATKRRCYEGWPESETDKELQLDIEDLLRKA